MNISRFIRLSGWALILGAAAFLTGLFVEALIVDHGLSSDPYNYYSRPIDQFLAVLPNLLMPTAMMLFTIGVMGLYQMYGSRASLLGKAGLVAGMVGGVLAFATWLADSSFGLTTLFLVLNQIIGGWWLWDLGMLAVFLLFGGIFTFGIDAVKRRLLSRWNFIPILAGGVLPLRILAGYLYETTAKGWTYWTTDMHMIDTLMLITTSISLMVLGYLLMSDPQRPSRAFNSA